jgi:squalene-hopene/tetraprenyl-beta-curcumene cyclase
MTALAPDLHERVAGHLSLAVSALFAAQDEDGTWQDTIPSAAAATAMSVAALHLADPEGSADLIRAAVDWLRTMQAADGGWGDAPGAPSTLVGTCAVGALALVSPVESRDNVRRGLERLEQFGGPRALRDPGRSKLSLLCEILLALGGVHDEDKIRRMPIEVIFLPARLRLRAAFIMPFLPWGLGQARTRKCGFPRRILNRAAERRIRGYLGELENHHGPDAIFRDAPLAAALMCLGLARGGLWPEIVGRCVRYLRRTARPDGSWWYMNDLSFSATSYVTRGLQLAGYGSDPQVARTLAWVAAAQQRNAFRPTGAPAGGWGWSVPSGVADTDDTAWAMLCLAADGLGADSKPVRGGVAWLRAMQNTSGSWSCISPNSVLGLDPPCPGMTAHAIMALHLAGGLGRSDPAIARAVRWLSSVQRADGSMTTAWYRGLTAGTGAALEALGKLGLADSPTGRRCREWLLANQQGDGGWGDGCGAPPTSEETAWALSGLLGGGTPADHPAAQAAATWLCDHQRPDGLWEPAMVGSAMGFLSYADDLMTVGFVLQALASYQNLRGESGNSQSTGG